MQLIKIRKGITGKYRYGKALPDFPGQAAGKRINFFIGTGFSMPLLKPQRNIDTAINSILPENKIYAFTEAYLIWNFFLKSIYPLIRVNIDISAQKQFTGHIKAILNNASLKLPTKQINLFTTNFDPLLEIGFKKKDEIKLNDGLDGRTVPVFAVENYMELKTDEIVYAEDIDKAQEIAAMPERTENPTVNIFKMHGSLTWKRNKENNNIEFVDYHTVISNFNSKYRELFKPEITWSLDKLTERDYGPRRTKKALTAIFRGYRNKALMKRAPEFVSDFYTTFMIVDPIKRKFASETIEKYYNKLLSVFAGEINRENALLFVFGSMFKDEHIRAAVIEALKAGSLTVFIAAGSKGEAIKLQSYFGENDSVTVMYPRRGRYALKDFNGLLGYFNSAVFDRRREVSPL